MLKTKTVLEAQVNDRIYRMDCDPDSPLGEVHDALATMKKYVVDLIVAQQQKETEANCGGCCEENE